MNLGSLDQKLIIESDFRSFGEDRLEFPSSFGQETQDTGSGVTLTLTLFGNFRATDQHGINVLPRGRKARALLAALVMAHPAPILRKQACELLWSRRGQEQARASLRQSIHELQESLAELGREVLIVERGLLRLQRDAISTDLDGLADEDPTIASTTPLPRGALLEDLLGVDPGFDQWLDYQRRKITHQIIRHAETMLLLPEAIEIAPRFRHAAAEFLLDLDPAHERASRILIGIHLAHGEQAAALHVFDQLTSALGKIGRSPSAATAKIVAELRRGAARTVTATDVHPALERCLRLGVLPFRGIDDGYGPSLAASFTDELSTALSRFRWFLLVACPSLAALATEPRDNSAHWHALDLDYLVEGTVHRSGDRLRVSARLLDLHAGSEVVWADRFERVGENMMLLQDDIAAVMVAQIDPRLLSHAGRGCRTRARGSLSAHERVLISVPILHQLEKVSFIAAGATLEQATILDPGYAGAFAWWAYWHVIMATQGWANSHAAALVQADALAQRAIMLDPSDALGQSIAGHVRDLRHFPSVHSLHFHQRALSLNPSLPMAWAFAGFAKSRDGYYDEAIRMIRHAKTLSPFDSHGGNFDTLLMVPHLLLKEFSIVVELGISAIAFGPALSTTYRVLLCAFGHLGLVDDAADILERLLALEPGFSVIVADSQCTMLQKSDRALYLEGLRAGGLQEE